MVFCSGFQPNVSLCAHLRYGMTAARPSNYAALIRKTIWTRSRRCIKGSQRSVAASPAGHQVQLSWTTCCCCKTGSDTAATAN